jgi:hypothetical protein
MSQVACDDDPIEPPASALNFLMHVIQYAFHDVARPRTLQFRKRI